MIERVTIVPTALFWRLMHNRRVLRTSKLSLVCGDRMFITLEAPEDSAKFIDAMRVKLESLYNGFSLTYTQTERKRK